MTDRSSRRRLVSCAAVLLITLAAARILGVLYARTATDIRYMETLFPTLLDYGRKALTTAAFGAGIAFTVYAVFSGKKREGRQMLFVHTGVLLADAAAAFSIDAVSGALRGAALPLAVLSVGAGWIWSVLLAVLGWLFARRISRRGGTPERAVLTSSAGYMAGRLLMETVYLMQFLLEVEFAPYPEEIAVIAGEFLSIVVLHGGITFLAACLCNWLFFSRNRTEK